MKTGTIGIAIFVVILFTASLSYSQMMGGGMMKGHSGSEKMMGSETHEGMMDMDHLQMKMTNEMMEMMSQMMAHMKGMAHEDHERKKMDHMMERMNMLMKDHHAMMKQHGMQR